MKQAYVIEEKNLNKNAQLSEIKYKTLFDSLDYRVNNKVNEDFKRSEISSVVNASSKYFTKAFQSVNDILDSEVGNSKQKQKILTYYSAYIASCATVKELENIRNGDQNFTNISMRKNVEEPKVNSNETDYSLLKNSLEGLVDRLADNGIDSLSTAVDYMASLGNQISKNLLKVVDKSTFEELSNIKWTVGPYVVEGIKVRYSRRDSRDKQTVDQREKDDFYTPLTYLHIPEEKRLPKERIVGDQEIITDLERAVKCLFLYNSSFQKNPAKSEGVFQNKILLQGKAGEGKGVVSFYAIDYAERFAKELGVDLIVTNFNIDSSYEDGKIKKLKSQLKQISENNQIYLIFEDEIDGLMMNEQGGRQKKSDLQVVQEFNKFMDGQYLDKGNYLLIGNVNNQFNLRKSNRRRFRTINWEGAVTPKQKADLFKYKLEKGMQAGYVSLNGNELAKLGQMAFDYDFSGSDITQISERLMSDSFKWDSLGDVYEAKNDFEKQKNIIRTLHEDVNFGKIGNLVEDFRKNQIKAKEDSISFEKE